MENATKRIAIFASGAGTNAGRLMEYFKNHPFVRIDCLVCNNPKAGVIEIAAKHNVPVVSISKESFYHSDMLETELKKRKIDLVVLAGFLWLVPRKLIQCYPEKMINLHPALLPKFGGAGMYGKHVHAAVLASGEKQTGITFHLVSEEYDKGKILAQYTVEINQQETIDSLQHKIHQLEHAHFPEVIEKFIG